LPIRPLDMKILWLVMSLALFFSVVSVEAREFSVYNVASALPMGDPGEVRTKDYYVNVGSHQGLKKGDRLEALRRIPSYDLIDQEFSRDLLFPIAVLKIIHLQSNAAICRLERMLPVQKRPSISPVDVMVGDYVRVMGSAELPDVPEKKLNTQKSVAQGEVKIQGDLRVSLNSLENTSDSPSVTQDQSSSEHTGETQKGRDVPSSQVKDQSQVPRSIPTVSMSSP
jgi:hypothetical protein